MGYPGGKSGPGVYHRLINLMPPHPVYCEPFLGGGAVMLRKRPAAYNIGVDLDAAVIAGWRSRTGGNTGSAGVRGGNATAAGVLEQTAKVPFAAAPGESAASRRRRTVESPLLATGGEPATDRSTFRFLKGDGLIFLASYQFQPLDLVYCDPPYLRETRSGGRLYRHELEDGQHAELLDTILELPCRVMISGYWSELYAFRLKRWNSISFEAMTRGGMATEWLWFNFPEPVELHDYRFLGTGNRERTDLKRQKERWIRRLERMPVLKKRALLAAISADRGGNAAGIDPNSLTRAFEPAEPQT